ncbi:HNH/ENDO VII family nuclease [Polaribacter sp. M15]
MIEAILGEAAKETVIKTLKEVSELAVKDIPLETMDIVENGSLEALEVENQLLEASFKSIQDMSIDVLEQKIYDNAGLEKQIVNGREVLIQTNIDYNTPLGIPGNESETNLERMKAGYAPIDENGNPYQLHHIGQQNDSPLAELTNEQHQYNGNYNILHTKVGPSEIDRKEFNEQRAKHWKERAAQIENSNN